MRLVFTNLTNLVALEQFLPKPTGVHDGSANLRRPPSCIPTVSTQGHKVCELGGDKLHRPPVVALRGRPSLSYFLLVIISITTL